MSVTRWGYIATSASGIVSLKEGEGKERAVQEKSKKFFGGRNDCPLFCILLAPGAAVALCHLFQPRARWTAATC